MTNFGNLPAVSTLATSLQALAAEIPARPREVFIKMDKTGHWVYGADQTEIESDSLWAVNPFSFVHGYVCWGADKTPNMGKLLGEAMASMQQPLPEMPEQIPDSNGWEPQYGLSLQCISGNDKGLSSRWTVKAKGGVAEVQRIALEIAQHVKTDTSTPVAVVHLKSTHYQHKGGYGRIFTPQLEIVKWVSLDAEPEVEEVTEAPTRRRRG